MTVVEQAERIRLAAGEELDRFRGMLEEAGMTLSQPELVVSDSDVSEYTAELKVRFYEGDDLVDIFEFFVCRGGTLVTSEGEVREWIQHNVPDVVRRRTRGCPDAC